MNRSAVFATRAAIWRPRSRALLAIGCAIFAFYVLSGCASLPTPTSRADLVGEYVWAFFQTGPRVRIILNGDGTFERHESGCDICPVSSESGSWILVADEVQFESTPGGRCSRTMLVADLDGAFGLANPEDVKRGRVSDVDVFRKVE